MTSVCHFCLQVLRNILAKQGSGSDRIELRCRRNVIGNGGRGTEVKQTIKFIIKCRCSSVVEHVIGNDGVVSPILISGTINKKPTEKVGFLLLLLLLTKSDKSVPENSNFSQIIGLFYFSHLTTII